MIYLELRTILSHQQRRYLHNSLAIAVIHIAAVFRWRYIVRSMVFHLGNSLRTTITSRVCIFMRYTQKVIVVRSYLRASFFRELLVTRFFFGGRCPNFHTIECRGYNRRPVRPYRGHSWGWQKSKFPWIIRPPPISREEKIHGIEGRLQIQVIEGRLQTHA